MTSIISALSNIHTLAWRPLLDPLPITGNLWWMFLIIPLATVIALVYKTLKLEDLSQLPRQTLRLTVTIVFFLVTAAAILWVITELV